MKTEVRGYIIESSDDHRNYIVRKKMVAQRGKNEGKETETTVGYFNSLPAAIERVASICGDQADDLKSWLAEYKAVKDEVKDLLS